MVRACAEEGYGVFRSTILRMELLNKRRTGRPRRRFVDVVRKGMRVCVKEEDVRDRDGWGWMISLTRAA